MKKNVLVLILMVFMTIFALPIFADDVPSSWAKNAIEDIFNEKLLNKELNSNYKNPMTRSEFAYLSVVLYENLTGNRLTESETVFSDSSDQYVLKSRSVGMIDGYPDGSFKPNRAMNRAEIAHLFLNILRVCDRNTDINEFDLFDDDEKLPLWARDDIRIAKELGIVNGVGENIFNYKGITSREQALLMFHRIYAKYIFSAEEARAYDSLKIGEAVPEFSLLDIYGIEHDISEYLNQPLLIFFCTSNDQKGKEMLDFMNGLNTSQKYSFKVLNINISKQDDVAALAKLNEEENFDFSILLDEEYKAIEQFKVSTRPYTFLLDTDLKVIDYRLGEIDESALKYFQKQLK